ncbi:hypothetical protein [Actinacidiphila oryziradicis]|uniref:hypothetical protein n=1 Tax=Actinacidiphila oryziradicis TaxID=2571141 RepID=UPI00389928D1
MVILPAHRDEEAAVSARFRAAHVSLSCPSPSRHRRAMSPDAKPPRCPPTARSPRSSSAVSRSRVRTDTPEGPGATNGAAITRNTPTPTTPSPQET